MTDDITVIKETKRLEEYLRLGREIEQYILQRPTAIKLDH